MLYLVLSSPAGLNPPLGIRHTNKTNPPPLFSVYLKNKMIYIPNYDTQIYPFRRLTQVICIVIYKIIVFLSFDPQQADE